jgi:hypothetical protein
MSVIRSVCEPAEECPLRADSRAKQGPPRREMVDSCYPLGSSRSQAARRREDFRSTTRKEFFNRIGRSETLA